MTRSDRASSVACERPRMSTATGGRNEATVEVASGEEFLAAIRRAGLASEAHRHVVSILPDTAVHRPILARLVSTDDGARIIVESPGPLTLKIHRRSTLQHEWTVRTELYRLAVSTGTVLSEPDRSAALVRGLVTARRSILGIGGVLDRPPVHGRSVRGGLPGLGKRH